MLPVVVLADLAVLLLFSFAMQFARAALEPGSSDGVGTLVRFAWEIGGAVAFGSLVGALFALYLRYVGREVTLVDHRRLRDPQPGRHDAAVRAAPGRRGGGSRHREPGDRPGRRLKTAVQRGATPVLVIFFVAVGTSLRLDALAVVGFLALALSAVRLALIRLGITAG